MSQRASDGSRLGLLRAGTGGLFAGVLIFSIFTNLLVLTGPLFMLQVYDRVLSSRSEETLVALTALVAVLFLFYGCLDYARTRVLARAGERLEHRMSGRVFSAALASEATKSGDKTAQTALDDLGSIRAYLGSGAMTALLDVPWTPVFLFAIFIFHPLLGWAAVFGGACLVIATLANQLLTKSPRRRALDGAQTAERFARDAMTGAPLVWSQGMSGTMSRRWQTLQGQAADDRLAAQDRTGGFSSFSKAFRLFLQSAILALGAWLVLQGQVSPGAMIAASILLGRALAPVEQLIGQWPTVERARLGKRRLSAFLDQHPEDPVRTPLPRPEAQFRAKNLITLDRPGGRPILHGVSFETTPGEALGVIGKSGAGKTTLARILTGTLAPAAGEVRLGGATLDRYGPEALGNHLGYLPQDVHLFEGTIAENIARMAETPDATRVVDAAKKARVHDIILALPEGYDTRLSPQDARLSGGQKQRVALARALYGDPVLLVLDEPNSALDADGSDALNAVISDMKADGRAVVVMTHRPTAIAACDNLLVLDQGRPVAYGPRDDVVQSTLRNANAVTQTLGRTGS